MGYVKNGLGYSDETAENVEQACRLGTGYWLAGERRRAISWAVLGAVEVVAIVL